MRTLFILVLVVMMATVALGSTGCCCVPCSPCSDIAGGLLGTTTMTTSPGDFHDIPPYPGSRRLKEVAIPVIIKTIFETMSGGGKFDVKGYGTGADPTEVATFYDKVMPENGWTGSFSAGSASGASATSQIGQFTKSDNTIAMVFVDKDKDTGQTMIIVMRMVVPEQSQ